MLEVSGIEKSFGERRVLRGVDLLIEDGELVGLIGPSGSGKSVLIKIIADILDSDSGSVHTGGLSPEDIGFMFQEGALFDSLTVFDNVAFPLVRGRVPSANLPRAEIKEVAELVYGILERVGLSKAAYKIPGQLSGGMRRRVSLARALVTKPKLALLDDPTYGLDPVASSVIMKLITDLHMEYTPMMLIVSQDLRRLFPAVQRLVGLFDGEIRFSGPLEALERIDDQGIRHFISCRYDLQVATHV